MAKNKFLLLSLDDDSAKKIANTINNESARKILDYLTDKDATESEIVKALKIPASTVNYNIEQLLNAKLVVWDKYHYSEKGKEVRHYSLANKYIIIAPKGEKESFLEILKKLSPAFLITIIGAFLIEYLNRTKEIISIQSDLAPVMMKSAVMVEETTNYTKDVTIQNISLISEPTMYFILGSLITIIFIFMYFYIKSLKKK